MLWLALGTHPNFVFYHNECFITALRKGTEPIQVQPSRFLAGRLKNSIHEEIKPFWEAARPGSGSAPPRGRAVLPALTVAAPAPHTAVPHPHHPRGMAPADTALRSPAFPPGSPPSSRSPYPAVFGSWDLGRSPPARSSLPCHPTQCPQHIPMAQRDTGLLLQFAQRDSLNIGGFYPNCL